MQLAVALWITGTDSSANGKLPATYWMSRAMRPHDYLCWCRLRAGTGNRDQGDKAKTVKSVNKVEDDDQLQLLFSQRRRKPSSPKTLPCLMLYQNAEPKCRNQVNMLKDNQCKVSINETESDHASDCIVFFISSGLTIDRGAPRLSLQQP